MTNEPRIHNEEKKAPSIKGVGETGQPYAKEWNRTTVSTPYPKATHSGWKMNVRPEIIKYVKKREALNFWTLVSVVVL